MTDPEQTTVGLTEHPQPCPNCGHYCHPHADHCPCCNHPLQDASPLTTRPLQRLPHAMPGGRKGRDYLAPGAGLILQFLPSGYAVPLALDKPVILGRGEFSGPEDYLNLIDLNGLQHGVSRQHCRFLRSGTQLIAIDLNSSNGTYLNDEKLTPHQRYVVSDGDRLILGTLHVNVFFNVSTTP
ncbi:MAG: FHA domain-containing protein [Anaerolineae bacterium]|nr:FHA domain-containing protein [Anaerolineae bacterium]